MLPYKQFAGAALGARSPRAGTCARPGELHGARDEGVDGGVLRGPRLGGAGGVARARAGSNCRVSRWGKCGDNGRGGRSTSEPTSMSSEICMSYRD